MPGERPRFLADAHLGALARRLRMAGFDAAYDNRLGATAMLRLAADEDRILLSRHRELLARAAPAHGVFVHATDADAQLRELAERLGLARRARPFTRCLACNVPLRDVPKYAVAARVPPQVLLHHDRFRDCPACGRLFWQGTHWQRMRARLAAAGLPVTTEDTMDEEALNISIRKFLKVVGVSSQREIEHAVAKAIEAGTIGGDESFPAKMTLDIPGLKVRVSFDGEIRLK